MKNKVKIIAASLAVGMAVTLTGCGGCLGCNGCSSCAGCGGDTVSDTLTRSNWYSGTSYNGIQPSFTEGNANFSKEQITYDVTYDGENANNEYVSLEYKDGIFTTEFYATEYDWGNAKIPDGFAPENPAKEVVYLYKTTLTISVRYTMKKGGNESSEWFNDSVETVSYFRAAGRNLQPVYSAQKIVSASPAGYQPKTLADAYKKIDVSYENFYSHGCDKVMSFTTENGEKTGKEHSFDKLKATLFDNSSLYIAVRSMKLSSSLSQPVALFSAAAGGVDDYAIVGSDSGLSDAERADYTQKLAGKGLYKSAEKDDKGVETVAVRISYAGGNLHGTSQTVWYASVTDSDYNVSRATMLKLSVPISFSLGTLNYSLKEINSTLWNG